MTLDNGGKLDQLLALCKRLGLVDLTTPQTRRDTFVSWVLSNLNASSNHKTTREVIERAYDEMFDANGNRKQEEPSPHQSIDDWFCSGLVCPHCGLNDGHHYVGCKALETK